VPRYQPVVVLILITRHWGPFHHQLRTPLFLNSVNQGNIGVRNSEHSANICSKLRYFCRFNGVTSPTPAKPVSATAWNVPSVPEVGHTPWLCLLQFRLTNDYIVIHGVSSRIYTVAIRKRGRGATDFGNKRHMDNETDDCSVGCACAYLHTRHKQLSVTTNHTII